MFTLDLLWSTWEIFPIMHWLKHSTYIFAQCFPMETSVQGVFHVFVSKREFLKGRKQWYKQTEKRYGQKTFKTNALNSGWIFCSPNQLSVPAPRCVILKLHIWSVFLAKPVREGVGCWLFFFFPPFSFCLAWLNLWPSPKCMGGIWFKIDILMLNFYCHSFCSCSFQTFHLFVSEPWISRKNVTIVVEH